MSALDGLSLRQALHLYSRIMNWQTSKELSCALLLSLALGCGTGSGDTSGEAPSDSPGAEHDDPSSSKNDEQNKSSTLTCCLDDGSAARLLFTEDEFLQLGAQLQWSETDQIKAERGRSVGQKGLDVLCGIEDPVQRKEDIVMWTDEMLKSAQVYGGEDYHAILKSKLADCAP